MYSSIKNEIETIDDPPEPLNLKNSKLLKRLEKTGFVDWSKIEFTSFITASEKYGHENYEKIQEALGGSKNLEQIKSYS